MIKKIKNFIKMGLCQNQWAWFHLLAGALGTKIFLMFFSNAYSFLLVVIATIGWEIIEYKIEGIGAYFNREKWFYDTLGDIVSVWVLAGIIIWV